MRGYHGSMSHDASYLTAYREAARAHGTAFDATLWASEQTQRLRFHVFAEMCDLRGKRILDAGCSRGDFAAWMVEHGIDYGAFIGVDAVCEMIDFAQTRNLPHAAFYCGDFVTHPELLTSGGASGGPQVVVFSGSLNTMKLDTALGVLEAGWRAASHTLLFNFLSDRAAPEAPKQTGPAYRLNTMVLLDWALSLSDRVAFRQDYFPHGHDATIRMDKHPT